LKRAPVVIGATGVGLGLLFTFHTKPVHVSVVSSAGTPTTGGTTPATTPDPGSPNTTTSPTTAPATRSATGANVSYRYGDLELKVTEQGSRITNIQIVSDQATDPRSEEINSQAIPILQQEALSAGSASIDGVSGATFTSEAYAQALQSALDRLK